MISTAVVTRSLDADRYGAWGLVLQLSTYFFLFDIGMTLAVSREVAVASSDTGLSETADAIPIPSIVSTATAALTILMAAGLVTVVVVAVLFDWIFGSIPQSIVPDARLAFVLVAGSLLAGLPFATVTGYFAGVRRSHVPAAIALVVKIGTTVGVILVAVSGGGIIGLAAVTAAFAFVGSVAVLVAGTRAHPGLVSFHAASRATWRRLRSFSNHALFYALATFTIVNVDALLVARFDYARLGAYIIAATVAATLGATHFAAVGALLPVVADITSHPDTRPDDTVLAVVGRTARYSTMFVVATIGPLLVGGYVILRLWVGAEYADSATGPMRLLLLASVIRFTYSVLTQAYFGLGDRWPVTSAIAIEAVTNLAASVVLGHRYGAPGVALGTLVGAGAGVIAYSVFAPRRHLGMRLPLAVIRGAARPAIGFLPIAVTTPWWYDWRSVGDVGTTLIATLAVLASLAWLVTCLTASDRERLPWRRLRPRPVA